VQQRQSLKEVHGVRPRGARLWRVLVAGGLALGAACAGQQHTGSSTGSGTGSSSDPGSTGETGTPNGMNPGPGDSHHGSGAGGW
jgi:hypothetical protein